MKTVSFELNTKGIDEAIKYVNAYKEKLKKYMHEFLIKLAERGVEVGNLYFGEAVYDGTNDVVVRFEDIDEDHVRVIAESATNPDIPLFIEFGTGVTYPDVHPEAGELGMVRGGYGYHLGLNPGGWRYEGDPGTNGVQITEGKHAGEIHTFGNPANASLYMTVKDLEYMYKEIAEEIFKG